MKHINLYFLIFLKSHLEFSVNFSKVNHCCTIIPLHLSVFMKIKPTRKVYYSNICYFIIFSILIMKNIPFTSCSINICDV